MQPQLSSDLTCASCPIRHRAVCSDCDAIELAMLEEIKYYRNYAAGQTILWAGDQMGFVGSVVRGVACLGQTLQDGRTQMLGLLLPSDFIGRPGRSASPYDVTAVSDVTLCCFRRKPFESLMISTPHVAERLLAMTLDELDAAREWMMILGRKTAREKLSSLLVILARRDPAFAKTGFPMPLTITLPLTRDAMANYLGLTLETVSRQISALKADRIITLTDARTVVVPDLGKLIAAAGSEMMIGQEA